MKEEGDLRQEPVDSLLSELKDYLKDHASPGFLPLALPAAGESLHRVSFDGHVTLHITEDRLTVLADFHPPGGNGFPLGLEQVEFRLSEAGITAKPDGEKLKNALVHSQLDRKEIHGLDLCKGKAPKPHLGSHWLVDPLLLEPEALPELTGGRIDFKSATPFIMVREDQILGWFNPEVPGEDGVDVLGQTIPAPDKNFPTLSPGPGTSVVEEGNRTLLKAQVNGRLRIEGGNIRVEEVLEVPGNVDFHTGHIRFAGHVILQGEIADGFEVHSGKSLSISRTVLTTLVEAGESLECAGGLLGGGKGLVRSGGTLKAKFLENIRVEAQDSVMISGSVLGSQIYTQKDFIMGEKSLLVGSRVHCLGNAQVQQVGTPGGSPTEVHLGINSRIKEELGHIRDKIMTLTREKKRLEGLSDLTALEESDRRNLLGKIQAAMGTLALQARELSTGLEENTEAFLEIRGMAYPGTLVEIAHVNMVIRAPVQRVRIRLLKDEGRLEILPLQGSPSRKGF